MTGATKLSRRPDRERRPGYRWDMRGLLVVNPAATATTERTRDVLASALATEITLDVVVTKGRGHAVELGWRAVEGGLDLVIALGGDGTVNEIANGMLDGGPSPHAPALAVVPGGSTNVFARALGFSRAPVEATGELLAALREGRSRPITLGFATFGDQSRWFTFCAGVGFDADVVAKVERRRGEGRRNTPGLYLRSAAGLFAKGATRSRVPITVRPGGPAGPAPGADGGAEGGGPSEVDVEVAVVCNTLPWTYLDARPVRACPAASFEGGLDMLGLRRLRLASVVRTGYQMLYADAGPHGRNTVTLHDVSRIAMTAPGAVSFQMDGEFLGLQENGVELRAVPLALRVVA
jgi:diacylglycerol kinase family enzyme